jgi:hypothetical protein
VAILLAVAALWYSQAPPRTSGAYEHEVGRTVELLRSQLRTAQEWARQVDESKTPLTTASVGFGEVEQDATNTANRFAGYQPPEGQDRMRSRVTAIGDDVVSALSEIRIAARRGNRGSVVAKARGLRTLDERLTRVDEVVTP